MKIVSVNSSVKNTAVFFEKNKFKAFFLAIVEYSNSVTWEKASQAFTLAITLGKSVTYSTKNKG